jgi:hypothetical protein
VAGEKKGGVRGARTLSTVFYIVSAVLIVVVVVLYFHGRDQKLVVAPTPPSIPGQNQLINVEDAFKAQGLKVTAGKFGANADALTPPGQMLDANGSTVYVFVYASPDDRTADADGVDASSLGISTLSGTAVPSDQLKMYSQSNIIAVLVGGDASLAARIEAGMKALP